MIWQWFHIFFLSCIILNVTAESYYSIIAPKVIRADSEYHVAVSTTGVSTPSTIYIELNGLLDNGEIFNVSQVIRVQPYMTRILQFEIGDIIPGKYQLIARGLSGIEFSNSKSIDYVLKSYSVFIQTDRAIYKPGNKVMFRCILLNSRLRPTLERLVDIYITDGKGNRIKQWIRPPVTHAIFNGEIELSEFPVLGTWKITANVGDQTFEKDFEVAEYVLPNFEVTIDASKHFTFKESKITATIYAKYTYGKPVKGEATITAYPDIFSGVIQPIYQQPVRKVIPINGKVIVDFDIYNELKLTDEYERPVMLDVTVEESLTGRRQNTSTHITLHKNKYTMDLIKTSEYYKPGLKYTAFIKITYHDGTPNINQMKVHSKISLPSEIMEHFHRVQCHSMMGLFTEISKAWLTIDSDIYVWSYENESDVAYFDGLNETIISVGLVKPKPNVFQSYVKYLLILTTTVEITILGVTLIENEGSSPEMQLVPEPIFTVATDGIGITTIANTNTGRIFLGGRNGSLYEIYYQAESSWFGKRCKKINHSEGPLSFLVPSFVTIALSEEEAIIQISIDDSRNILYTLGDKGTITVWDIDNDGASKVASLSQASLVQNAVHVVKTLDSNNFRPLVSISAITESESVHLNLVVIAATGTRFYCSCTSVSNPTCRPQGLQLIHVRLPPGYAANATVMRPRKVQMAHYRKGTLILVCGGDTETVLCLSNDAYPFTNYLAETQSPLSLDSPFWTMAEILVEPAIRIEKQSITQEEPPLVVRQHMEAPRKFIFLTSQGAIIYVQVRPMDILKQLLLEQRGPDTEAIRAYFQSQSLEQACATCLILATLESSQNAELAEWATRAFFLYGSQRTTSIGPPLDIHDICTSTPRVPNYDLRLQAFRPHAPVGLNTDISLQQFSAKHNGLYLYVGRILRPIWNMRCIKQEIINNKTQISSTISTRQVSWILSLLQALRSFLNKNTHITKQHGTNKTTDGFETTIRSHCQEPIVEERNSLAALKIFITHACEVLELWKILCENHLNNIVNCLSKDQINQFSTATFRDLILIGHEISSLLIIHLIDSYLADNASVDAVSQRLREVCPNLYRNEDAVCSKANEIILKAKSCTNLKEKECYLRSALKLCKEVAPRLNLSAVCQQFIACQFYVGVLELCISCAERVDPNNTALHYYKNNEPKEDQEGYMKRLEIYKEFITLLDHLYNQSISNPLTPTISSKVGSPSQNSSTVPVTPAKEILQNIITDALHSTCEILHASVYAWMMERRLHGELIALAAPSLETYLTRVNAPDLLWQFYEKNKNHAAAAKILDALATKESNIPLSQRVEYLARAVVCMRSDQAGYAPYLDIFLRELEDKVEVARIQQQILDTICNQHLNDRLNEEIFRALNSSLLDITKLYEKYADPLQLSECKLAIIHCSGHQDAMLIQEIWTNIINNELKDASTAEDKMTILMSKIISLGQEYSGSPHCFPVDFLIKQLEIKACKLNVSNTGIISGFLQLGVSMEDLLDIYKMIGKDTRTWLNEGNEFHLIESTANLINYFISHSNITNTFIKRKIITKCQDVISKCLLTLQTKPHGQELITRLRSIQNVLNRM